MTLGRAALDRCIFIYSCYSIDGAGAEQEPANSDSAQIQRPSSTKPTFHQATVDYRRCLTELPVFCNRDDHLVRTLVAARCSTLYFLTNFVSSVVFSNHSVF